MTQVLNKKLEGRPQGKAMKIVNIYWCETCDKAQTDKKVCSSCKQEAAYFGFYEDNDRK